jgi:hypothetical protein
MSEHLQKMDLQGLGTVSLTLPQLPNYFSTTQPKLSKKVLNSRRHFKHPMYRLEVL